MTRLHLDLFSGIGGFALAARWTGWTTIAFSEINPYASKVLRKHWPDVPNLGDIRNVHGIRADLVTGGFPCQPFSTAGKRRGADDDRYLWPEMLRVIAEAQPRWMLGENFAGIIGMALDTVLSDLEAIGYVCGTVVVPACAVDAPHRRDRVWIVANRVRDGSATGFADSEVREERIAAIAYDGGEVVADADSLSGWAREPEGHQTRQEVGIYGSFVPNPRRRSGQGPRPGERRWSEPAWWEPEPDVGRVAHGIPRRVDRLRGLGNAIVPQVAAVILEAMAKIDDQRFQ